MAHVVVHGHFYQPPRENPWSGLVPRQPSASPFHDWNERIAAECYRPNGWARIMDGDGGVLAIVNNYELLSFNVGPTLAAWLERHAPDVHERMVRADGRARTALAQPYHHVILPLSSERDRRTELRWGRADFRRRFGREPEGVWLPETAVDDDTLAAVADEGFAFTILDPSQLERPRPPGAYRWSDGRRSLALVVYEGAVSHDVAFGLDRMSSAELVSRAVANVPGPLVCLATDGETFGHHHKFTERAVAYALAVEARRQGHTTGALGTWLARHPPTEEVGVRPSAWSCAHGLGRWTRDCGCSSAGRPGWTQAWRAPLRAALDLVRDHAGAVLEAAGGELLVDPWRARDDYVEVVADPAAWPSFAARHLRAGAPADRARDLLEAQRHALAMYTSCGWFFDDPAGLETVIVLRHAACCLDRLRAAGDDPPEEAFLGVLAGARSNEAAHGDGRDLWSRLVLPGRQEADLEAAAEAAAAELAEFEQQWFERHREVLATLVVAQGGLADELALRVAAVLGARLREQLAAVAAGAPPDAVTAVLDDARRLGARPAGHDLAACAGRALAALVRRALDGDDADAEAGEAQVAAFLAVTGRAAVPVAREPAQEIAYDLLQDRPDERVRRVGALLGLAVDTVASAPPHV